MLGGKIMENAKVIRVAKKFGDDIKDIKIALLKKGIPEDEATPKKITDKISKTELWKQIVKKEIGEIKEDKFDLRI